MNSRIWLCCYLFLLPLATWAKDPICRLHPEGFDRRDATKVEAFEKNIEAQMSSYYERDFPELQKSARLAYKLEGELVELRREMERKLFFSKRSARGSSQRSQRKQRLEQQKFREFLATDDLSYSALSRFFAKDAWPIAELEWQDFTDKRTQLKTEIERLNQWIKEVSSPHFLSYPKVEGHYFQQNGEKARHFSSVQMELFVKPPSEKLFTIPVLGIGFETDANTILYACIHLNAFRPQDNAVYIYFLNTSKLTKVKWTDYFMNWNLALRDFLSLDSSPRAYIAPAPFTFSIAESAGGVVNQMFEQLPFLAPFDTINQVLQKIGVGFETLSFVEKTLLGAVGVGPQGIYIDENGFLLRWGVSTLFGLWSEELAKMRIKKDLSVFMNVFGRAPNSPSPAPQKAGN